MMPFHSRDGRIFMNRAHLPRLPLLFVASAVAIPAIAVAEPPPPAAPAPVAVPYPNTSARDAATGLPTGKRMHKPYTLTATTDSAPAAKDLPDPLHPCTVLLCLPGPGKAAEATTPAGQPTACATVTGVPDKLASDPEEGGQVARTAKPKPPLTDLTVTKKADTASTKLMDNPAPASTCPPVQH
jgi:hypothetical protein